MLIKQPWYCLTCQKTGIVGIDEHADTMTGVLSVQESHHEKSPECGNEGVRAVSVKMSLVNTNIPEWAADRIARDLQKV